MNHFDDQGRAVMVDVSGKPPTLRTAEAGATVFMEKETLDVIRQGDAAKGDVLGVARLAGIAAAKKTSDLIPLSHPLSLHSVSVEFQIDDERSALCIRARVRALERTGVEMEAMTAASVAALTVYDMAKGIDRSMRIGEIALLFKEGGKSGTYRREEES